MIISRNPAETMQFGIRFAENLRVGDVLAVIGDLGAGKTHFVKGVAQGLGFPGDVTSPTFTLIQEYTGGNFPVYHMDFYRLETEEDALQIGIEDYFHGNGVCVVEWADKFRNLIPAHAQWLNFRIGEGDERIIEITDDNTGH